MPVLTQEGEVVPGQGRVPERRRPLEDRRPEALVVDLASEHALEDGVGEIVLVADALEERKERAVEVARAPAHRVRVEGHDERAVVGGRSALEEADSELAILRPVELVPTGTVAGRAGDVLERRGGRRADHERQADARCGASDGRLAVRVDDRQHPDGRKEDGRGHRSAEHGDGRVERGDVTEHARHEPPRLERSPVRARGRLGAGGPCDVREGRGRHPLLRERLEPREVGRQVGNDVAEPRRVDLVLVPGEPAHCGVQSRTSGSGRQGRSRGNQAGTARRYASYSLP